MESVLVFLTQKLFAPSFLLPTVGVKDRVMYWQDQPIDVVVITETPWYVGATAPRIDLVRPAGF